MKINPLDVSAVLLVLLGTANAVYANTEAKKGDVKSADINIINAVEGIDTENADYDGFEACKGGNLCAMKSHMS